jgi:DNA-binding IclR family transcriptional regulator
MLPGITPEPLRVACDTCGAEGFTFDYQHPDAAVECGCCPVRHDHAGLGCRTVTIYGTAHLRVFEVADLMDAADPALLPASDQDAEVAP